MGQWSGYDSPANQHVAWQRRVVHRGGEGPLRFRAERSVLHWAAELLRRLVRPGQQALPLQGIVRVTGVLLGPETVYCQSPRPPPFPAVRASNSFCVQPLVHDSFLTLMPPVLISVSAAARTLDQAR